MPLSGRTANVAGVIGEHTALIQREVGRTGLTLILPASEAPTLVCTVPVKVDEVCGVGFPSHQRAAYERHVALCIKAHEEAIHVSKPSVKRGILSGIWDKDLEAFMERNREALAEGRKRL